MIENLLQSLWITLLGMGLVFAAIILLWGAMALMTAIRLRPRSEAGEEEAAETLEEKRTAAAVAVAIALALARQAELQVSIFPLPPTAVVSAWQLTRRTENLNKQGITRR